MPIAKGTVSATAAISDARTRRAASIGPGEAIGELAYLNGGKRSANVVADGHLMVYVFSVASIRNPAETHHKTMEKTCGTWFAASPCV